MDIKESKIFQVSSCKERHPWERARLSVIDLLLKEIIGDPGASEKAILDFGCGDGFVIQSLSRFWPTLTFWGIDSAFTEEQINFFSSRSSSERCFFFRNLESIPKVNGLADVILLLDMLEHTENDSAVLSSIVPFLKPDGYVLITVPAFQCLFSGHDRWLGHYRRYTKSSLRRIVCSSGLQPYRIGYFFSGLIIPRLIFKLLERSKILGQRKHVGIGEWTGGVFWGKLIKSLLIMNARVDIQLARYNMSLFGLSVFAICRK